MRAIRSINNNIAVCIDSTGAEVIAMGKGIGYGAMPHDVELSQVSHTYYSVDERQLAGIKDIDQDVLAFAADAADRAREQIPYQMSPNLAFTLADHISFALKRERDGVRVYMPLAYDVEQNYPIEYRLGRQLVRRLRRDFGVPLRESEASGIALCFAAARLGAATDEAEGAAQRDEDMLEDITELVENEFGMDIDRTSFAWSRYATHLNYLFHRLRKGEPLEDAGVLGLEEISQSFPKGIACVEKIGAHLQKRWGFNLSDEEKLYLMLHISRICAKGQDR